MTEKDTKVLEISGIWFAVCICTFKKHSGLLYIKLQPLKNYQTNNFLFTFLTKYRGQCTDKKVIPEE